MELWGSAEGLLLEGQARLELEEDGGPAVEIPNVVPLRVGRCRDRCQPWMAYLEANGKRAVVHTARLREELFEALEADKTFGPAASRYYRLWRTLHGHAYGSATYQSEEQKQRAKQKRLGALPALLALDLGD